MITSTMYADIHYWPATGRILAITGDATGATVDDLRILNTGCDALHLATTTARYAELIADATPNTGLTAHHRDNTVTTLRISA